METKFSNATNDEDCDSDHLQEEANLQTGSKTVQKWTVLSFVNKLKRDPDYRSRNVSSIALVTSFIMLGWITGLSGPTFLDLTNRTEVSLEKGSRFFTAQSVGWIAGAFAFGYLYDKISHRKLSLVVLSQFGSAVVLVILPWCRNYGVMLFIHSVKGFLGAGLDTCGNAHLLYIWGDDGKSYMQALHFAYAFGGIVSPFIVAPFLSPMVKNETFNSFLQTEQPTDFPNLENDTDMKSIIRMRTTNFSITSHDRSEYRLYIPFLITALVTLASSMFLFYAFVISNKVKDELNSSGRMLASKGAQRRSSDVRLALKVVTMVTLMFLLGLYCAVEVTFTYFLTAFCVTHMQWSKFDGAAVNSVFWISFAVSRFLGIFIVLFVKHVRMIFILCFLLIVSFLGLVFTSLYRFDTGIWISTVCIGLASSMFFPTVFLWIEEKMFPVTGLVSSFLMVSTSVGVMINPLILGVLMDRVSPMWFTYLLLGETVLLLFVAMLVLYLSGKIRKLEINNKHG